MADSIQSLFADLYNFREQTQLLRSRLFTINSRLSDHSLKRFFSGFITYAVAISSVLRKTAVYSLRTKYEIKYTVKYIYNEDNNVLNFPKCCRLQIVVTEVINKA